MIEGIDLRNPRKVALDETMVWTMEEPGVLAFDGERELVYGAGDEIGMIVTRTGPWRIDVRRAMELALERGFFRIRAQEQTE